MKNETTARGPRAARGSHAPRARRRGWVTLAAATHLVLAALAGSPAGAAGEEPAPLRYPPDRAVDVERIRLDLDVDLEGRRISGRATIAGRAIAASLAELRLDAVDLDVRAVSGPDGRPLSFRATGTTLSVALDPPLRAKGERFSVDVEYAARPSPEAGGLWFFGPSEEEPDVPLQVWTQGESEDARRWFPCVDTPEERQQLEVVARVPAGMECLSNGALVERADDAASGKTRFHWRQQVAVPAYLATLVVGRFAVVRQEWDGVPVLHYVPPEREKDALRSFSETPRMLDLFSRRIGVRYPFEKYAQVCVEQFIHGGMENSSATTLTDSTLHDERAHLDYSSEGLVAHELAHQWWGDLITCRDWKDIWLNEGFASYFEAVWEEEARGADEYAYDMLEKAGGALGGGRETPLVRRRYRDPDETFGGGTYPKGAWVLHMLRREVGDGPFWASIRRYADRHRESAVESDDLRRALEAETGRSLCWFFDQWLERPGHPVLEVGAEWREEERLLALSVKQTQPAEPFRFAAEFHLGGAAGPEGVTRTVRVPVEGREARMYVPLPMRPAWISFDPRQAVLRETTLRLERDLLEAALARDPSPVARVDAARALAAEGEKAIPALARALVSDPFSGVRAQVAAALGGIPGEGARDALLAGFAAHRPKEGAGTREQARVRLAVVEALGGFRKDERAGIALAQVLYDGDPSYAVEGAAARSLARLDLAGAFEPIALLLERDSHEEGLRRAAVEALSELRDPRAYPAVRAWARKGRPRRVRVEALAGLGRIASRAEFPEPERITVTALVVGAADERAPRIRAAAIGALREIGARGDERALPALEALALRDPRESIREQAKAAAEAIRAGRPADREMARLRDDVARLAEENRSLKDRLDRFEAAGEPRPAPPAATPPVAPKSGGF